MFLMERPSHAAVQDKLWSLYLHAEEEKEEMKNRLKYKVSVCSVLLFGMMCCVRRSSYQEGRRT